jgi:acyl-CoA dehydrogenase
VLAAEALTLAGSVAQKAAWLPSIASGQKIGTFAYAEGAADWRALTPSTSLVDGSITGIKMPVADGGIADFAVVLVDTRNGPAVALVDLDQPEVTRQKLDSFDQLRAHYAISFAGAKAELLDAARGGEVIARLLDSAAVQAAFEAVGGAQACLAMARDYAMERQIFGRSLASYQAIKHKLADIAVAIELALSNTYYAAWAVANAPDELPAAAAAARLTAIAAFESAARENIQVHGGIGYTFEANCHFYYRRERTLALSLGGREVWADRLIAHAA